MPCISPTKLPKPLKDSDPLIVYQATLDNKRYLLQIVRLVQDDGYRARFALFEGEVCLHEEEVWLAYGALFGPDVDDVRVWQDKAIRIVDARLADSAPPAAPADQVP